MITMFDIQTISGLVEKERLLIAAKLAENDPLRTRLVMLERIDADLKAGSLATEHFDLIKELMIRSMDGGAPAQEPIKTARVKQNEPGSLAWKLGEKAATDAYGRETCPYKPDTVAYEGWNLGYDHILRRPSSAVRKLRLHAIPESVTNIDVSVEHSADDDKVNG